MARSPLTVTRWMAAGLLAGMATISAPAVASAATTERSYASGDDTEASPAPFQGSSLDEFESFEQEVLDDVNAYWESYFADDDGAYVAPSTTLTPPGEVTSSPCGYSGDPDEFPRLEVSPAFYRSADNGLYLSTDWLYRDAYQEFGDFAVAVIIAHEMGHHVQHQVGVMDDEGWACCGMSEP
jgi:hypothetical protein